ncbi:MAG TPA: hypothetical protein VGK26_03395 [Thermoanaerobaculia bacterium]|jgi:hypothetical protein
MSSSCRAVRLVVFIGMVLSSRIAVAGPATHLSVSFTVVPCPDPGCTITRVARGQAAPVLVVALDALEQPDPSYRGTVAFSSSDPLATIPASHTFTAADQGFLALAEGAVFQTLGSQTLTGTDAVNGFTSTAPIDVVALRVEIPVTSVAGKLALIAALAAGGAWILGRSA